MGGECKLEWKRNFYPLQVIQALDWGCYSPLSFEQGEQDGVKGAWVDEGVCSIHGVVVSRLGAAPLPNKEHHPCGAYDEGHVRMKLVQFDDDVVSKAVHDSIPDPPKAPVEIFANWQPVKCSSCWWHGPASKSIRWFGDTAQTCPNCGRD